MAFLLALLATSCQDPLTIGDDLLSEDQVNIGYTDTLKVRATSIMGDTVRTFAPTSANQLQSYLFGQFRDPVFGLSNSTIYAQVRLERTRPDFSDARLDSVVLVLPYDTVGIYGQVEEETFGMEIRRLAEDIDRNQVYFSNVSFATEPAPLVTHTFTPSLDSIEVIEYVSASNLDTARFPHLRVPLDPAFGEELLSLDTNILASDSAFLDYFKGIQLRPTLETPGILSFALNETDYRGGIYLYYTEGDTVQRQFHFEIDRDAARMASYDHHYDGAPVEPFIGNYELGDSLIFLQGMAGLNAEIEILGLDEEEFDDVIINKAEIEITLQLPDGEIIYEPAGQLLLSYKLSDGTLAVISDVSLASSSVVGLEAFGGDRDDETNSYTMNISTHLQEILEGTYPNKLYLTVFPKGDSAERSVFYGAEHPVKGIKLRVAYTKL